MMTSFTKIFVVLAMTRNALSLPSIPPNQVLAGLALFLSIFVMWPVINEMNTLGIQPYLNGTLDFNGAVSAASRSAAALHAGPHPGRGHRPDVPGRRSRRTRPPLRPCRCRPSSRRS